MSTLAQRLKLARTQAGLSQTKLGEKIGVSQNAIQKIESGGETKYINQLAKALNVNSDWLQFGVGEKENKQTDDVEMIESDKDYSDTHISIDLYDIKLSARNGKPVLEWTPRKSDEPLLFREAWFKAKRLSPQNCKAMYVRGHSMTPVLENWDTVIVDIADTEIVDGEIYALIYNHNFYIKQVVRTGKGIDLLSYNPEYPPIPVSTAELNDLQIIGRKVWRGG